MAQCSESSEHKEKSDKRIAFLADRMAVMMVILQSRHGGWEWFYGENTWRGDDNMANEIRDWKEYDTAKEIIKLWIRKDEQMQVAADG